LPGLALALLVAVSLPLYPAGCSEEELPPLPREEEDASFSPISGLSADQSRTIDELGYPDHFFIIIDPISSDRIETWTYFSEGKALDFDNGRLLGEEEIEDESEDYPPTDLQPQDFDALLTPLEAEQLLGPPIYTHEVQDSLMPENTIIVFDNAVLIYQDEQFVSVDTQVKPPDISAP
jgi:hypothetical protein